MPHDHQTPSSPAPTQAPAQALTQASAQAPAKTPAKALDREPGKAAQELAFPSFARTLRRHDLALERGALTTLQVNIGKLCNQWCSHCHVEAGPAKVRENMDARTVDRVIELMSQHKGLKLVDITGGAPELNPEFRRLVTSARSLGLSVIDRCNLTILSEPGQEDTSAFLANNKVDVVASLPCYSSKNVDEQRGDGVFDASIRGLIELNSKGYGMPGSGLTLDLVYNPLGAFLPPPQEVLLADYSQRLKADFGIVFNNLFTITNMPIKRFYRDLVKNRNLSQYMNLLADAFNADSVAHVMCRNLVSISWDGQIYDCDFNQALDINIPKPKATVWAIDSLADVARGKIAVADHCFACTAGAGSSCGGSLV